MNFFERVNAWLDRSEVSWVTLLTKILPILVPIIPAFQTKYHVVEVLGYDDWMGWAAAVIVEFFGYAAMYKMIQFAFKKAGFWTVAFAVVIYIVYLAIILVFNVIPEIEQGKPEYIIWMNALFSLLSVPAGALTAISAVHTEREEVERTERERTEQAKREEAERRRAERKEAHERRRAEQANEHRTPNAPERRTPNIRTIPQPANEQRTNEGKTNEQDERPLGFPQNERRANILSYIEQVQNEQGRTPGPSEIARTLGVSKGYASDVMNGKV